MKIMPKQHTRQGCKSAVSLPYNLPMNRLFAPDCGAGANMGYQKLCKECDCAGRITYWLHSFHSIEKHIEAMPFGSKSEWKAMCYGVQGNPATVVAIGKTIAIAHETAALPTKV